MQTRLFNGSDPHAWHAYPWPETSLDDASSRGLVIQPVFSLSEWALGRPLDSEEVVGSEVIRQALEQSESKTVYRVLPPLRTAPRLSVGTCFGIDVEIAHRILRETILSATMTGHRRFLLFNTSPFLEEWIDVAARDLRVDLDLQLFCVNLSGLGLDFHPLRANDHSGLQAILTHLLGVPPERASIYDADELDPIPGAAVPTEPALQAGESSGKALLAKVAESFAAILAEIDAHPDLLRNLPDAHHGFST